MSYQVTLGFDDDDINAIEDAFFCQRTDEQVKAVWERLCRIWGSICQQADAQESGVKEYEMSMTITGDRVRCANCGMIYNKPPAENIFWIGVPFRVEGMETCPGCGSNAADPVESGQSYGSGSMAAGTFMTNEPVPLGEVWTTVPNVY